MKINARHLILDLLLASDQHQVSVREAITACGIFAISENSVRVALVRLSADGLVQAAGRGHYRLGPQAMDLAGDVATWRSAEQRLSTWHGDWITVFTANLGRTNRTALKRRERALNMLGFRELFSEWARRRINSPAQAWPRARSTDLLKSELERRANP